MLDRLFSTNISSMGLACIGLLCFPSCLLQPREAPGATPAAAVKKKSMVAERWQSVGGGMLGVSSDKKGSNGNWSLDDGPKPGQRSLLIEYDLKPGGFVSAWHTTERLNLAKADGLRFMAQADPPATIQMSMTDANRVSHIAVFVVPAKEWTEIHGPLAALVKNANVQPPD